MRDATIARNYAGALFDLGIRHGEEEGYARSFRELADALVSNARVRHFLETPKIGLGPKQAAMREALEGKVTENFLRFVLVVLAKGRQRLLPEMQGEYETILDEHAGRLHVEVTLAREPDAALRAEVAERLTAMLGKTVVPHFTVDPAILGGLVVRYGDHLLDSSLRRQLVSLKREMMHAGLPELPAASA